MAITLRQESDARATTKSASLNFQELDNNFIDLLNRATLKVEDDSNTQITLGNDGTVTAELKVVGAGGLTTSVTSDSTGQAVLTLTQAAAAGGGISEVVGGTNITVSSPDSAGAVTIDADVPVTDIVAGDSNITVSNADDSAGAHSISLAGTLSNLVLHGPSFKGYQETVHTITADSTGAVNVDIADGNVQEITLTDSVTFTGFANAANGQSVTLILKQDGTGNRTFTESLDSANSMVFAGGTSTLSTAANAIDIMTILYAGGVYYASLSTNFS
jgi:hypothetical protein